MILFPYAFFAAVEPTSGQIWVFLGILISVGGGLATVAYGKSGRIQRTEAEKLWEVNQKEKDEFRQDIKDLKALVSDQADTIVKLREEQFDCRSQLTDVKRENGAFVLRIEQLETQLREKPQ